MKTRKNHRYGRVKRFFACRQHPITILSYIAKYLWLLLIPLGKYLIATQFNITKWVKANWVDILIITFIFAYAFLRWCLVYFTLEEDCLVARTGFFGITQTRVYFNEISSLSITQGYGFRLINACSLYLDTDAPTITSSDIQLICTDRQAMAIYDRISRKTAGKAKCTYIAGKRNLAVFSLMFSSALSGVALALTAMYEAYKVVGREAEEMFIKSLNDHIERLPILRDIPVFILAAGILIAGGWLLSFLSNLMRHWNFVCTSQGGALYIKSGLGLRRRHILIKERINYVDFQQSLLMKLFRVCSVSVSCTGYGKRRKELSAIVPVTTSFQAERSIKNLLPDLPKENVNVKTGAGDLRRFITIPLIMCTLPFFAYFIGRYFLPDIKLFNDWERELNMVMAVTVIPFVWYVFVRAEAAFNTFIGMEKGDLTLGYCKGYKYHKVNVRGDKISMVKLTVSPFQRLSHTCKVKIYTVGEKKHCHRIKGLNTEKTRKFFVENGFALPK